MALKESLLAADTKAQYAEHAKEILANAQILGRIMQECVDEFKGKSLSEVISAVNRSELVINKKVPVEAGLTNRIVGDMQEDAVNNEGIVYFDLLFSAAITGTKAIAVRINIEAQRKYNPSYDLIPRGIFYCARLISSQGNTIFSVKRQEYDKLQKVYSIWICMDSPNEVSDGITSYQMQPEAIYGTQDSNARYDLLEVVSIRLGKHSEESKNTLIKVLSAAFSEYLSAEQKIEKLRNYGVQVDETLRKEINEMCDLSDGVYNSGYDAGYGKGFSNKTIQIAKNLLNAMPDLPDQKIADIVKDISAEEVEKLRKGENL